MHVITRKAIKIACKAYPWAAPSLLAWLKAVETQSWNDIQDLRHTFPSADAAKVRSGRTVTVFNLKKNELRIIAAVHYNRGKLYVLRVLTHSEYSKNHWKTQL
jgi:mRNA interferase HigB